MAKERKPSKLEEQQFLARADKIDVFRGTQSGLDHLGRRERWDNERTARVQGAFAGIVRSTFKPNKHGVRIGLEQAGPALAAVSVAVHEMDAAAATDRAAKAQAQVLAAAPTSAERAEAQAPITSGPESLADIVARSSQEPEMVQ